MSPEEIERRRRQIAEWLALPDSIGNEEFDETQQRILLVASFVAPLNLPAFLSRIETASAVAPLFHPSLWIEARDKLERMKALARAANVFRAEVLRQAKLEIDEAAR